jgi:hypothetical protein
MSKLSWHEKHIKDVFPEVKPSKEWLLEVKHSSEAIQILSPSTAMPTLPLILAWASAAAACAAIVSHSKVSRAF